ncbi:phosphopantetheine-binding protein [Streptomyces sp. NPDC008313]|uniref:phosphopantetheine-binding protein n=1 Tax=Streptomyces sp. NPDC008313 TaxID=3364826 RepID=UPI0036E437D1
MAELISEEREEYILRSGPDSPSEGERIMWDEKFEETLRKHLPFLNDGEKLESGADLRDLGLDSLGMVELLASLESAYDVRFVDDALTMDNFATPDTLWNAVAGLAGRR